MKKVNYLTAVSAVALVLGTFPAQAQQMDFGALESLFGEPVTTSATGKPQRVSEAPVNMEIVTADDIRRSGARSIPEALKGVSGLDVIQTGVNSFDVAIRGHGEFYNPRVLVMVNGRQVYIDNYGFTSWSNIPVALSEIRQIEVVKGPNTALFGFNAVAGVVNIITYNPIYDKKDTVSVTAGTDSDYRASVSKTLSIGEQSGLRLTVGGTRANEFESSDKDGPSVNIGGTDNIAPNDPLNKFANLDGRFKVSDKGTLTVSASTMNDHADEIIPTLIYANAKYDTNSLGLGYTQETSEWGVWEANVYHNSVNTNYATNSAITNGLDFNNEVTVAKLQNLFKVGTAHSIRLAGEYRHNWEEATNDNGELSYDVYSASAMWDWMISDSLSWTNALRVDKMYLERTGAFQPANPFTNDDYDRDLTAYSANSGLVYKLTPNDSFGLSYGRGIQVPSLVQLGAVELNVGPLYFTGSPDLSPTVVTTYETNYTHKVPSFSVADNNVEATMKAAVFRNIYKDLIGYPTLGNPSAGATVYYNENIGSSSSIGFELGAKGKVNTDWKWGFNYILENISDDIGAEYGQAYDNRLARHIFNANLGYATGKWETDVNAHVVSGHRMSADTTALTPFDIPSTYVDPVFGLSARVGYKVTDGLTVSLNGSNLQGAETEQTSGRDVNRAVWLGLTWDY